jgi:peptidoglycan/LPS O-acetylase OafA/YrhL
MRQLGDASYSIYHTHGFVVPVVGLAFIFLHWTSLPVLTLAVLTCLAACSIVGAIVYKVVKRPIMLSLKHPAVAYA